MPFMRAFHYFSTQINTAYMLTPIKFLKKKLKNIKLSHLMSILFLCVLHEKERKMKQVVILL